MPGITVNLSLYWDRDEPDGSKCEACGDQCFLAMWRAFVSAGRLCSRQPLDCVLCDACHWAMMEETES